MDAADDAGSEQLLRVAAAAPEAEAWLLALASQGMEARVMRRGHGWGLWVDARESERAEAVLRAADAEARAGAAPEPDLGGRNAALAIPALLLVFYWLSDPGLALHPWFAHGMAVAERIRAGELWRTVTALTLHLDLGHVLGNVLFLALFARALFRALGPGLGSALILAGGASGNALNAFVQEPAHFSVGASTAVFATIGSLVWLEAQRMRARRRRWWRAWLPLGAGIALLSLLGGGERSDATAHVCGLASGIALAWPAARLPRRSVRLQAALGALAAAVLVASWWLALAS